MHSSHCRQSTPIRIRQRPSQPPRSQSQSPTARPPPPSRLAGARHSVLRQPPSPGEATANPAAQASPAAPSPGGQARPPRARQPHAQQRASDCTKQPRRARQPHARSNPGEPSDCTRIGDLPGPAWLSGWCLAACWWLALAGGCLLGAGGCWLPLVPGGCPGLATALLLCFIMLLLHL